MERTKRNTKIVGDISEIAAIRAFVRAGYRVALPFGENNRYDLVVERNGAFSSVQVKTGRLRGGVIRFNPWSMCWDSGKNATRGYSGEVDCFAVYCPETDAVYRIPVADVGTSGSLRVVPTRNGQARKIRWAASYLLRPGRVRDEIPTLVGTEPGYGVRSPGSEEDAVVAQW